MRRQTYGYLPSCKASPPIGWYQIILLGDRGTCVLKLAQGCIRQCGGQDSNPWPVDRKSSILTTRPPSHSNHCSEICQITVVTSALPVSWSILLTTLSALRRVARTRSVRNVGVSSFTESLTRPPNMYTTLTTQCNMFVCLFAWGLTALSAQIGYIAP